MFRTSSAYYKLQQCQNNANQFQPHPMHSNPLSQTTTSSTATGSVVLVEEADCGLDQWTKLEDLRVGGFCEDNSEFSALYCTGLEFDNSF